MGLITAKAPGKTTISIKAANKKGSFDITVTDVPLRLSAITLKVSAGGTEQLTSNTNEKLVWQSSDEAVATVLGGAVHGVSTGTAVITAATQDGKHVARCHVTITHPVLTMIESVEAVCLRGAAVKLPVVFTPADAPNKGLIWTSANPGIAAVDATGNVRGVSPGTTSVTAQSRDGGFKAEITVYVPNGPRKLRSLTVAPSANLMVGSRIQLNATISPRSATGILIRYESAAPEIATVDALGRVTGHAKGQATINVRAGHLSRTVMVNVQ